MRVEMHQRHALSKPPGQRAQQRQSDPMLAPQAQQMSDPLGLGLDQREGGRNVAQSNLEIADVSQIEGARVDPERGMRAIDQHAAGAADRGWTFPGPGTIGCADIEWNTRHGQRRITVRPGHAEETRRERERWIPSPPTRQGGVPKGFLTCVVTLSDGGAAGTLGSYSPCPTRRAAVFLPRGIRALLLLALAQIGPQRFRLRSRRRSDR